MTSKHTPGPWVAGKDVATNVFTDCRRYLICSCEDITEYDTTDSEKKANARLIAAAPELLAALRGMIDYAASEIGIKPEKAVGGHFKAAREAIAKAEGRA